MPHQNHKLSAKSGQKPKKSRSEKPKKSVLDVPLDSDDDGKPETEDVAVDWKDEDLNWQLVNFINDCDAVKQGLFPSPGNDTRSSKGVPKSDHHYAIAAFLFANHPKYKTAFARIATSAGKRLWATKIKNRLSILVKACRQYTDEMGETGAGLIQRSFPWYWVLKALIAERPNITPVGLGNTATGFDVEVLVKDEPALAEGDSDHDVSEPADDAVSSDTGSNEGDIQDVKPDISDKPSRKRTCAKPTTSVTAPKLSKKPKTSHEKFSDIAIKEEETTQKLLDIKKQKMEHDSAVNVAAIQAKAQLKIRRSELQAQLVEKREEHRFQLELARIQSRGGISTSAGPSTASSSAASLSSPFSFSFNDVPSDDGPYPPFNF